VPKREVFGAYVDFCSEHHFESTTPASFGKFLKKVRLTPPPSSSRPHARNTFTPSSPAHPHQHWGIKG
jgi:hypothetical protein